MIIWVLNPDELYLAKQHGYAVADNHVFIENGGSGKTLNRSGLREVRSLVQVSAIQALICLDPDRLAGNLGHLLLLEEETKKHGVQLLFMYLPREDSPEGKLMYWSDVVG